MTTAVQQMTVPTTAKQNDAAPREYLWSADDFERACEAGALGHDRRLELIHGRIIDRMPVSPLHAPGPYHWTADAFDCACDVGVFGSDARLELIHGRIIDRMGQSPLHLSLRVRIGRRLRAALEPRCLIVEECSIRIDFDGEPVADVAVLHGEEGNYNEQHPTPPDVLVIVEVAVSSAENDLGEKALLYAQAGIIEYWVVLPERAQVMIHREPKSDGYASVTALGVGQLVTPLAAPESVLAVADLLGLPELSAAAQTGTDA